MSTADDHAHEAEPVTRTVHTTSWSANLETPEYADDPDRVVGDAIAAIEQTAAGYHVNLVTHASLGHPEHFLYVALEAMDGPLEWTFVDQCGCGGYVTRVHKGET